MKRRKWWIIAFSLVLVVTCEGVWKWSERPPYAFMEGARIFFVKAHEGGSTGALYYTTTNPFRQIAEGGRVELGETARAASCHTGSLESVPLTSSHYWETESGTVTMVDVETASGWLAGKERAFPNLPQNATGLIEVSKSFTVIERFRSWTYRLRQKGLFP
jgi:hypothetical protein